MPEFDIVSIGECMVELYGEKPFLEADAFHKSYGGDTLNVLVSASRLGSRTGYITRIGEDHFAPYLLQGLLNERIDLSLVRVIPERKNSIYFISTFEGGGQDYASYRDNNAASTLSVDDLKTEYVAAAKYFHASGLSQAISKSCRDATYEACRLVKENQTGSVSYDPHYSLGFWPVEEARVAFSELLPYIDILFLDHPFESEHLFGITDSNKLIRALWQQGVRVVVLKLGTRGCIVGESRSGITGEVEPLRVGRTVDQTGFGDAFSGAFLHGLARGFDIFQAAWLGNITAGLKTRGHGTIASLPAHGEVYQIFEEAA